MPATPRPDQNRLLAALPPRQFSRLCEHLELVPMNLGDMVYEPLRAMRHAIFPTDCVVSLHHVTESGASCETAGVGREGMVGVPLFMGGESTPSSAVVHTAGHAYRLPADVLRREFARGDDFQRLLLRYAQALITQITQTAGCNRHHSIVQNLSRWLLSTLDRLPAGDLLMTQELLGGTLGVRREGITDAAGKLQRAGWIRYRRGHISVLDRAGLETQSCECYAAVRDELRRLLRDPPVAAPAVAT